MTTAHFLGFKVYFSDAGLLVAKLAHMVGTPSVNLVMGRNQGAMGITTGYTGDRLRKGHPSWHEHIDWLVPKLSMVVTTPAEQASICLQCVAWISPATDQQRVRNLRYYLRPIFWLNDKVVNTELAMLIRPHTIELAKLGDHNRMGVPACYLADNELWIDHGHMERVHYELWLRHRSNLTARVLAPNELLCWLGV